MIISMLTDMHCGEDMSIISIYGFGGLGKTTLARLAFNDDTMARVFDQRVWVYVSMKYDLKRIGESILSQVQGGNQIQNDLQNVMVNIRKVLAGKRFLIILDDLWQEDGGQLERLKAMLKGGARGSKIIVTTRSEKVATLLNPSLSYQLDVLSDDECWILFKQRAFLPGTEDPRLEEIGKDIVKKCKGVPLAAQSLGYIMRFKEGVAAWEAMRDSDIWEMEEDQNVLPSLKLSYYNMPSHLRLCFAYCAVFSKCCVIDIDMLIQQWIALGLVRSTRGSLTLEKRGEEYVKELVRMCFLQVSTVPSSVTRKHLKSARLFQMHDLVCELARYVAGEEFLLLDAKKSSDPNAGNIDCRYVVLVDCNETSAVCKTIVGNARALHLKDCKELHFPKKASPFSKFLRVLDLSGCSIAELPNYTNQLKQLQYLDVSGMQNRLQHEHFISFRSLHALNLSVSSLETLPVHIGSLDKLHYLNLHNCSYLLTLPESFGELGDLLHLDLSGCSSLQVLPASFGKLQKLSFLNLSGCVNLENLPISFCNLCLLEDLNLSSCHELRVLPEQFGNLQQLRILDMSGCHKLCILPESFSSLLHLEDLDLSCCCQLQELPQDFGMLKSLRILHLSDCHELRSLPESFTGLMNLEDLILSDCWELKDLPKSFGNLGKLRSLDISCCSQLFELPESLSSLINLEHLNLSCCVILKRIPGYYGNLKNLETLNLSYCPNIHIPHGIADICSLKSLSAIGLNKYAGDNEKDVSCAIRCTQYKPVISFPRNVEPGNDSDEIMKCKMLEINVLGNVQNLEEIDQLELCRRHQLHSLRLAGNSYELAESIENTVPCDTVLEKLLPPRTLEHFELAGYNCAKFPSWMMSITLYLPNLVHLKLSDLNRCDHLPPLGQLPKLRSLVIASMLHVRKVGTDFSGGSRSFLKLRVLSIVHMPNLEEWQTMQSANDSEEFMFPNLHHLKVSGCPRLRFEPFVPQCLSLEMYFCNDLLSRHSRMPLYRVPTTRIGIECCVLSSTGWRSLQCFSSLKFLSLYDCERLSSWRDSMGGLAGLENLELSSTDVPECLGDLAALRSLDIISCSLPCNFPQQLQQLTALESLLMSCCSTKFEQLSEEEASVILRKIPNVRMYHVGPISCVEQQNGILSTCRVSPTGQNSSGSFRQPRRRRRRQVKIRPFKLRRHRCKIFVRRFARKKRHEPLISQYVVMSRTVHVDSKFGSIPLFPTF